MGETIDLNWPATIALTVPLGTVELIADRAARLVIQRLERMDDEDRILVDVNEAGRFLGITGRAVRDLVREDAIPHTRSEILGKRDTALGFPVAFSSTRLREWVTAEYEANSSRPGDISAAISYRRKKIVQALVANFLNGEEAEGCVYFGKSQLGGDLIKIGFTTNLHQRMADLKLEPLVAIPGTRETETKHHDLFEYACVQGEWFRPVPDLLRLIEKYQNGGEEAAA